MKGYELEENSQGYFRVKLPSGQYLMDSDLMLIIASSHRSKIMTYGSKGAAIEGYGYYLKLRERNGVPFSFVEITEDFKPIKT